MATGPSATASYLRRTANLPTSTSFTVCGWCKWVGQGSATAYILFGLESATTSAGSGIYLEYVPANFDLGLLTSASYPTRFIFPRSPQLGDSFFWAVTGRGTGATDIRAYWWLQGASTPQITTITGISFTTANLILGSESYGNWGNFRFANIKVFDVPLEPENIWAEVNSPLPIRRAGLNSWSPFASSAFLGDYANGRTWSSAGTITDSADPILATLQPSPLIQRLGRILDPGDLSAVVLGLSGWESVAGARPNPLPRVLVGMEGPQPVFVAPSLGSTGWEPAGPSPQERLQSAQQGVSAEIAGASNASLRSGGFEPPAPKTVSPRGKAGVSFDGPMPAWLYPGGWYPAQPGAVNPPRKMGVNHEGGGQRAFLLPEGWESAQPLSLNPARKTGSNFDGPLAPFSAALLATGWESAVPPLRSGRAGIGGGWNYAGPSMAFLYPGGWEPLAPQTRSPSGKTGVSFDGTGLLAQLGFGGWDPAAPAPLSQRGKQGVNFDGTGLLAALGLAGWEPPAPRTASPRGKVGQHFDGGGLLAFLGLSGWEAPTPQMVSPRSRGGVSFDASLLFATLAVSGWEPGAPVARRQRAPWSAQETPQPGFTAALLSTGWEPSSPRTQSPHSAAGANQDGWPAFPLRSGGFEPLAPWTRSPQGKVGVSFDPRHGFVAQFGATGWEPAGPMTVSPRGRLAPSFYGPLVAFPLRAGGWEPLGPITRTNRPGIGVSHDPFLTVINVLAPAGWETASPPTTSHRGALGVNADAGILVPPRPVTGWELPAPYRPRAPRPGLGWNFDQLPPRVLGPGGWEPEAPRPHPSRPAPGPNWDGPMLAFLRASGWEPEPANSSRWSPRREGSAVVTGLIVIPPSLVSYLFGPPSVAVVGESVLAATVGSSRTIAETEKSEADTATEKSRLIVVLSS